MESSNEQGIYENAYHNQSGPKETMRRGVRIQSSRGLFAFLGWTKLKTKCCKNHNNGQPHIVIPQTIRGDGT
ncbi:MAG: hypothetical protein ABSB00_01885 [Minisyncoccia bacterium]